MSFLEDHLPGFLKSIESAFSAVWECEVELNHLLNPPGVDVSIDEDNIERQRISLGLLHPMPIHQPEAPRAVREQLQLRPG